MQPPMLLHVWRACCSARSYVRVDSCGRARPVDARVCARVRACLLVRLCARACTACVNEQCVRAPAAVRAWLRSLPPAGLARVGRRYHLDEPHGQGAVGCAVWAHVRDRCRRRHLRHRRLRQRGTKLPPGRVGEHRRRCAAELSRWGVVGGTRRGTQGGTRGGSRQADPPTHAFRTFTCVALPPSQHI
jgi:hypothetical protein